MRFIALACALALTGCAKWSRPGGTEAEFYQDRFQCDIQSASAYPVMQTPMGAGYQAPARVNCTTYGNQTNCQSQAGQYVPPVMTDVNAVSRSLAWDACMRGRGWTK